MRGDDREGPFYPFLNVQNLAIHGVFGWMFCKWFWIESSGF